MRTDGRSKTLTMIKDEPNQGKEPGSFADVQIKMQ